MIELDEFDAGSGAIDKSVEKLSKRRKIVKIQKTLKV